MIFTIVDTSPEALNLTIPDTLDLVTSVKTTETFSPAEVLPELIAEAVTMGVYLKSLGN